MVQTYRTLLTVALLAGIAAGCRGAPSEDPPIHPIRNMYHQPRYIPQAESQFFADGRTMRPLVAGTVPREAILDPVLETGWSDTENTWVRTIPESVVTEFGGMEPLLARGQERYGISCSPCHGLSGAGDGIVPTRQSGPIRPPTFHDDRMRHLPDGQIFATITYGVRNMPAYGHSVRVRDRWAIVGYLRALQISQGQAMEAQR